MIEGEQMHTFPETVSETQLLWYSDKTVRFREHNSYEAGYWNNPAYKQKKISFAWTEAKGAQISQTFPWKLISVAGDTLKQIWQRREPASIKWRKDDNFH